ncbi:MAG TPA: TIGR04076 family protein [Acidobacteriota bacterium]
MERKIKSVTAKIISLKGSCWHKVGDAATFADSGVDGKICIHAMYSMLPKVFAMMYGARFPWLQNPDVAVHACPDPNNPVVFEITRNYAE